MSEIETSAALLIARAHREVLLGALRDFEDAVANAGPRRAHAWADEVQHRLTALEDAFRRHVRITEEPDGLYADIERTAPRLTQAMEALRTEHREILDAIAALSDRLFVGPTAGEHAWVEDMRGACLALMSQIVRHRHKGADLTYEAYEREREFGGG